MPAKLTFGLYRRLGVMPVNLASFGLLRLRVSVGGERAGDACLSNVFINIRKGSQVGTTNTRSKHIPVKVIGRLRMRISAATRPNNIT